MNETNTTKIRLIDQIKEAPTEVGTVATVKNNSFEGSGFWLELPPGCTPKAGDTYKIWGEFGRPVRGLAFNDEVFFYRTSDEQRELQKAEAEEILANRKAKFAQSKETYLERISKLPEVFQKRFDRFRAGNQDFDWEYGEYELMACEEAVIIADTLKSPDKIKTFGEDGDCSAVPNLSKGHSGNSFAVARRLAYLYLENPEMVSTDHGALAYMVGCDEYGCTHEGA